MTGLALALVLLHTQEETRLPAPYIELHIDFNEDGDFTDSGEEVSADLKTFILSRGKDPLSGRAPAASLSFALENDTHKYTPTNTSSSLYPFQLPGPECRLRLAYPYDSFTDDDGTSLNGRSVPQADNQSQADSDFDAYTADSQFEIRSNHLEITSGGGQRIAVTDFGTPNVRLGADIIREDGTISYPYKQSLFTFRYQDSSNYNEIYLSAASPIAPLLVGAGKVVAGTPTAYSSTQINAVGTGTWNQGDSARVEVEITDEQVIVWVNDQVASIFTGVDGFPTATEHGIGGANLSTNAASGTAGSRVVQWDNFGGWNTAFRGRVDSVEPHPGVSRQAQLIAFDDFERINRHPTLRSTSPPATFKELVEEVLDSTDASADRGYGTNAILIADTGQTLNADFEKTMGRNGLVELYQIQDDEAGFIWIDGRGTYRAEANDHRDSAPHDTHLATWEADSSTATSPYFVLEPQPRWHDGKDIVENEIYYRYYRATKSVGATVWNLEVDDNPDLYNAAQYPSSAFRHVQLVAIDESNALSNLKQPVPGTDYTIFENADGTGVNFLTPLASETGTVSMVANTSLDDTGQNFGNSTTVGVGSFKRSGRHIVIQDNSGNVAIAYAVDTAAQDPDGDGTRVNLTDFPLSASPGTAGYIASDAGFDETDTPLTYDTLLNVGYVVAGFEGETAVIRYFGTRTSEGSLYITSALLKADQNIESNPTAARAEDATSQSTFGRRRVDYQTKYIDTWDVAQSSAAARLAQRKDERERFIPTIRNATKANLMEIIYRDVSDRVRVNYSDMGLSNRNYWIENYIWTVTNGGKLIDSQYTLVKVV